MSRDLVEESWTSRAVRGNKFLWLSIIVLLLFQILYSFLSIGWGLIADIDIESERLRSIGGQRFTVWSLARLVGKCMTIPAMRVCCNNYCRSAHISRPNIVLHCSWLPVCWEWTLASAQHQRKWSYQLNQRFCKWLRHQPQESELSRGLERTFVTANRQVIIIFS
jgi:hypothetical protein